VIQFRLDASTGVPPYLQIVHQVEQAMRVGQLVVGDRLPLIREVVAALVINPNTVHKAYRDLEARGLLEGRPGQGTYVRATLDAVPFATHAGLRKRLGRWVSSARAAGLDEPAIAALFATTVRDTRSETVA
jgi:GntR family transcriptional regulator